VPTTVNGGTLTVMQKDQNQMWTVKMKLSESAAVYSLLVKERNKDARKQLEMFCFEEQRATIISHASDEWNNTAQQGCMRI
jgi:hypothetical protein